MKPRRNLLPCVFVCGLLLGTTCGVVRTLLQRRKPPLASPVPRSPGPTDSQLATAHVNESGMVPILEYHDIDNRPGKMSRSPAQFRKDLQRLYTEGYRPIPLRAYLDNRIDTPLGTTPVILTFDDARASQFRYRPDGSIDPDCALGILMEFNRKHPDFPVQAVFFVLPWRGFDQPSQVAQKFQTLLQIGCELGNHTLTHPKLSRLPDIKVQMEFARGAAEICKKAPQAQVDTLALPFGVMPKNRALLAKGKFGGLTYTHRAVLLAGGNPARSPVSPRFKPFFIPRIEATEEEMGLTFWLDRLKRNPRLRYISDGDAGTVTVPRQAVEDVDRKRLKQGIRLRTYHDPAFTHRPKTGSGGKAPQRRPSSSKKK